MKNMYVASPLLMSSLLGALRPVIGGTSLADGGRLTLRDAACFLGSSKAASQIISAYSSDKDEPISRTMRRFYSRFPVPPQPAASLWRSVLARSDAKPAQFSAPLSWLADIIYSPVEDVSGDRLRIGLLRYLENGEPAPVGHNKNIDVSEFLHLLGELNCHDDFCYIFKNSLTACVWKWVLSYGFHPSQFTRARYGHIDNDWRDLMTALQQKVWDLRTIGTPPSDIPLVAQCYSVEEAAAKLAARGGALPATSSLAGGGQLAEVYKLFFGKEKQPGTDASRIPKAHFSRPVKISRLTRKVPGIPDAVLRSAKAELGREIERVEWLRADGWFFSFCDEKDDRFYPFYRVYYDGFSLIPFTPHVGSKMSHFLEVFHDLKNSLHNIMLQYEKPYLCLSGPVTYGVYLDTGWESKAQPVFKYYSPSSGRLFYWEYNEDYRYRFDVSSGVVELHREGNVLILGWRDDGMWAPIEGEKIRVIPFRRNRFGEISIAGGYVWKEMGLRFNGERFVPYEGEPAQPDTAPYDPSYLNDPRLNEFAPHEFRMSYHQLSELPSYREYPFDDKGEMKKAIRRALAARGRNRLDPMSALHEWWMNARTHGCTYNSHLIHFTAEAGDRFYFGVKDRGGGFDLREGIETYMGYGDALHPNVLRGRGLTEISTSAVDHFYNDMDNDGHTMIGIIMKTPPKHI